MWGIEVISLRTTTMADKLRLPRLNLESKPLLMKTCHLPSKGLTSSLLLEGLIPLGRAETPKSGM